MYNSLTLTPAYGRDYKSKKALLKDWNDNLDFVINDSNPRLSNTYVNKQQQQALVDAGYTHLHFRYSRTTQVHVVRL